MGMEGLVSTNGDNGCAVCHSAVGVGVFSPECLKIKVCELCYESERFTDWLAGEFEKAVETDPSFRKNPDGTWRRVDD